MRINHDRHRHDVYLNDDGTLDTVITVDGVTMRYDCEFGSGYRAADGAMTRRGLRALAIEACDDGLLGEEEETT